MFKFGLFKHLRAFGRVIKHVYRYGGYSTINIQRVSYGKVLDGKKVIVTGGSSGIGLSIAKKLLSHGATVLITGRNLTTLETVENEIDNNKFKTLAWDVSIVSECERRLIEAVEILGGEVDILVNNAGVVNSEQFMDVSERVWDKIYATNSKGLFFLTQNICRHWLKREKRSCKKIINISSQGGFVGATYPYRMTKWDVAGLTQGLGLKLAPDGIIINGIAPGIISTKMQPTCIKQGDNIFSSQNPLKRFGLPEEIAELALFLAGDSSNFIVGQTIVCDGGYSLK